MNLATLCWKILQLGLLTHKLNNFLNRYPVLKSYYSSDGIPLGTKPILIFSEELERLESRLLFIEAFEVNKLEVCPD